MDHKEESQENTEEKRDALFPVVDSTRKSLSRYTHLVAWTVLVDNIDHTIEIRIKASRE